MRGPVDNPGPRHGTPHTIDDWQAPVMLDWCASF